MLYHYLVNLLIPEQSPRISSDAEDAQTTLIVTTEEPGSRFLVLMHYIFYSYNTKYFCFETRLPFLLSLLVLARIQLL